jgi:hypothetical protein
MICRTSHTHNVMYGLAPGIHDEHQHAMIVRASFGFAQPHGLPVEFKPTLANGLTRLPAND